VWAARRRETYEYPYIWIFGAQKMRLRRTRETTAWARIMPTCEISWDIFCIPALGIGTGWHDSCLRHEIVAVAKNVCQFCDSLTIGGRVPLLHKLQGFQNNRDLLKIQFNLDGSLEINISHFLISQLEIFEKFITDNPVAVIFIFVHHSRGEVALDNLLWSIPEMTVCAVVIRNHHINHFVHLNQWAVNCDNPFDLLFHYIGLP
jgi:hypothetical protein